MARPQTQLISHERPHPKKCARTKCDASHQGALLQSGAHTHIPRFDAIHLMLLHFDSPKLYVGGPKRPSHLKGLMSTGW